MSRRRQSVTFVAPGRVETREEALGPPGEGQVIVKACWSAISAGTEMLFYSGLVPEDMALDESIAALSGTFQYPFKYGYASMGVVKELGEGVDPGWQGKRVFSFHPHESHYCAATGELFPVPDGVSDRDAVFLANMETAVNFVMDGQPVIGETAAVFGLGIVGLLTVSLLAQFPLEALVGFDPIPSRRKRALEAGADAVEDPSSEDRMKPAGSHQQPDSFDLVYELSGAPAALNQAISLAGFDSRVVVGSWYGRKPVALNLGDRFHRSRMRLISSQVSTLAPLFRGRWTKERRLETAWRELARLRPAKWITAVYPVGKAADAYTRLSEQHEDDLQIVLSYPDED